MTDTELRNESKVEPESKVAQLLQKSPQQLRTNIPKARLGCVTYFQFRSFVNHILVPKYLNKSDFKVISKTDIEWAVELLSKAEDHIRSE